MKLFSTRNLQYKTLQAPFGTFDHSEYFVHELHKPFLHLTRILTILYENAENIAHYLPSLILE